jgi:hypothetical protein
MNLFKEILYWIMIISGYLIPVSLIVLIISNMFITDLGIQQKLNDRSLASLFFAIVICVTCLITLYAVLPQ